MARPRLRLVQLPIPPMAAMAPTGNVPLAAGCLAVACRVHGLEGRLEVEVLSPAETDEDGDARLADRIADGQPEVVGFSLYLWNSERSLHVAREVKHRSPSTLVLVGGPEVGPDNPFVLGQEGFDVAVTGEAEDTFAEVLGTHLAGRSLEGLAGVAVRGTTGLGPFGAPARADFPIDAYESPYLAGFIPVDPERSTYVETVRGCRSRCTFCFYPRSSSVLRALPVRGSADRIARLAKAGAREVVFLDPTFNHRPDFVPLLDALAQINRERRLGFFAEVRAEGLNEDHADRLARAGFTKLEIGLQSVNPSALARTKRGGSPEAVARAARLLKSRGIRVLVDLIVGLPGDRAADVLRGVDWLLEHDLGDDAQVFPLAVLPGTRMRQDAARDGLEFEPAPPYTLRRSRWMDAGEIAETLLASEERLGRRIGERPRMHLVAGGEGAGDVFHLDLDVADERALRAAAAPGARHASLWLEGSDLWADRARAEAAIDARLSVDPYAVLDVVLCPLGPFPLDLLGVLRRRLAEATPSYASRLLAWRGEDAQRRLGVVLRRGRAFPDDWVRAVMDEVPVFREQPFDEALSRAERLGDDLPAARILGAPAVGSEAWRSLVRRADPEAVAFAERVAEAAWTREVLGWGEVAE